LGGTGRPGYNRRMGLDLTVMASHFRDRRGEMLPTATLRFDRDDRLFSQLTDDATPCLVQRLPDGLTVGVHEDAGLRFVLVDRYDRPLTCTTPEDIRRLVVPNDTAPWNRAIISFLLALPPDARIVLYWC
jgi:hypothetical protein